MPRPSRTDLLLGFLAVTVTVAGSAVLAAHHPGPAGYLPAIVAGVALAWCRTFPTAVLAVVFAAYLADTTLAFQAAPLYPLLIVTLVVAVIRGDRRVAYGVLVAGYLVAVSVPGLRGRPPTAAGAISLAAWFLVLAGVAEIVRVRGQARSARQQEAAQAAQARREQARRRAGEERLRIARDLHDVLAHQLALISVQANVGLALLRIDVGRAEQALNAIKAAGNAGLAELRSVLDTLRSPDGEEAPLRPIALLSRTVDREALFDRARAAGLTVVCRKDGAMSTLPATVDQVAYRVVQEALTNAVRHAGPGAVVTVVVARLAGLLRLVVEDDGGGASASVTLRGGGNGLSGMRERVTALGGTLIAGPLPEGGFRVVATIGVPEGPA